MTGPPHNPRDSAPAHEPSGLPPPSYCPSCGRPAVVGIACLCIERIDAPLPSTKSLFGPLRLAAALYAAYLVIGLGLLVVYFFVGENLTPEFEVRAQLATDSLFALATVAACWFARRDIAPLLRAPRQKRWLLYAAGLSIVTYFVGMLVSIGWRAIFDLDDDPYYAEAFIGSGLPSGLAITLAFTSIALFPGVFEELAFRGVIGTSLSRVLEPRDAIVVTALLFAAIHLNAFMFVHLLWVGLVLAFLLARSRSLLPGMVLHFCHNALCVTHELVPGLPG